VNAGGAGGWARMTTGSRKELPSVSTLSLSTAAPYTGSAVVCTPSSTFLVHPSRGPMSSTLKLGGNHNIGNISDEVVVTILKSLLGSAVMRSSRVRK